MENIKIETENSKWKIDFWTTFFAIISLILFNLALFIPKQRTIIFGFFIVSIIFTIFLFYIKKININEAYIKLIQIKLQEISNEVIEKFNYLKEIHNLKVDVEMLKKKGKKANIDLMDFIKILIAVILIYVIIQTIKSLF